MTPDSRILSGGKANNAIWLKMSLQNPYVHGDRREKRGQALQFRGIVNDFFFFCFLFLWLCYNIVCRIKNTEIEAKLLKATYKLGFLQWHLNNRLPNTEHQVCD